MNIIISRILVLRHTSFKPNDFNNESKWIITRVGVAQKREKLINPYGNLKIRIFWFTIKQSITDKSDLNIIANILNLYSWEGRFLNWFRQLELKQLLLQLIWQILRNFFDLCEDVHYALHMVASTSRFLSTTVETRPDVYLTLSA